jgi:manganese/zinc/iron transport system permease protein
MFSYLMDPVLRGPVLGCTLMCLTASLMGAIAFLKKRSLLGEALSHAAYPGVVCGSLFSVVMGIGIERGFLISLLGALIFSLFGLLFLEWLEKRASVKSDAALCALLASFFGIGILGASYLQFRAPLFAKQAQLYLYGQAATMSDLHVVLYAGLALLVVLFLVFGYRPLQVMLFDREFAHCAQMNSRFVSGTAFFLFLFSIVIGIRCVGVILMSGMLIAPAVAARFFTDRFSLFLVLSGLFGFLSGLLGTIVSIETGLPTGPAIICVGAIFALFALLCSPKKGYFARAMRVFQFRFRCLQENILKTLWKKGCLPYGTLRELHPSLLLPWLLWSLRKQGWIQRNAYALSSEGAYRAERIVRLHRLWETYLVDLGWPLERVHHAAEEMEHVLTEEFEERLIQELHNPKVDPHAQPIPERR